jgi:glucose/arabinose dehydrogenase
MRPHLQRRAVLAGAGSLLTSALAGCVGDGDGGGTATTSAGDSTPTTTENGTTPGQGEGVGVTQLAGGLRSPVDVIVPDPGSLLVAEQPGRVVHVADGQPETLLDLRDRVVDISGYSEQGLLGVTTHPNFGENGRLFVRYSAPPRSGTPEGYSHTFVLSEFQVDPDEMTADAGSEQVLLEIPEPQSNHNGGDVLFGPDGFLYVPVGDGGGAGDQGNGHVKDWYGSDESGNGQDVEENLLGSILRLDVDSQGGDRPYAIPDDNPLVGQAGLDEHYAWGLRNPWRCSFGPEGRLFAADVGQNNFEEVDVVEAGGNYGWNVREGTACFQASDCPTVTDDGQELQSPIIQYGRDGPVSGVAVVGGHLYDGDAIPGLQGQYVFGDWQSRGRLFVAEEAEDGLWPTSVLSITNGDPGGFLLSMGTDADGELLVCTNTNATVGGRGGGVFRVTAA